MDDPFSSHDDHYLPFADTLSNVLAIFLFAVVLLFPFINTVVKQTGDGNAVAAGNIIIEIGWVGNSDVDTWVMGPDNMPVGYSAQNSKILNLLRDDLGQEYEALNGRHYENVYSRGTPAGEYVVNVHLFRLSQPSDLPIEVEVAVRISYDPKAKSSAAKEIIKNTIMLERNGQEKTAIRFRLNDEGILIPDSVTQSFKKVRNDPPEGSDPR